MNNRVTEIKEFIRPRVGQQISDAEILREINLAWSQIYATNTLPFSTGSVFIKPPPETKIITLPYYVEGIRAIRAAKYGPNVRLNAPDFYFSDSKPQQINPFEFKRLPDSAINREFLQGQPLTIWLPRAQDEDIEVTVIGQGAGADRARESILIPIGEREATTSQAMGPSIVSITKSIFTQVNIEVRLADGTEIATLPNDQLATNYVSVQLTDQCCNLLHYDLQCFEVLFKRRAPLLWFEEDAIPDNFHIPVQNLAVANILMARSDKDSTERAANFGIMARGGLQAIRNENAVGTDYSIRTGTNPFTTNYNGDI